MKELNETVNDMLSSDYLKRLNAEYDQVDIRINKLSALLNKYKNGEFNFEPNCPIDLLEMQLDSMMEYRKILGIRIDFEILKEYGVDR